MLHERTKSYEEEWKAQGKDVPTEDEWYKIVEGEAGGSDVVYVVEGSPLKGSDFPFIEGPGKFPKEALPVFMLCSALIWWQWTHLCWQAKLCHLPAHAR